MHKKVVLAASSGAASPVDKTASSGRSGNENSPPAGSTERTVLLFLGGVLGGLMILSLGFVAFVSYEGFHRETMSHARPAVPD